MRKDKRFDYGEDRYHAIEETHGCIFLVAFAKRPGWYQLISFRRANEHEQRAYRTLQKRHEKSY